MRIKKIELSNGYKRFHHLTIDLGDKPARIVALVGPNGSGKSSVLDGMLARNAARRHLGSSGNRDSQYHSMRGGEYDFVGSIDIQFDDGSFEEIRAKKFGLGKENTIFSFRSCYRYNNQVKIQETTATPDIALNRYGASVTADLDGKMEQNYRRLHGKYNQYLESSDSKPSEAKAKIIGELNKSLQNCLDVKISSLGNIEKNQGTLYFEKPDHPQPFEFNVLSAGEKEVVDILLDLYLRQDDYDNTIFLIDEPELHINTAVQRKLLIELNRLIGPNCQLWVATHSAGFLRALQEDLRDQSQVIHLKGGIPYGSQAVILKPVRPTVQTWREIFETALDDLAGLVSPRRIIYCEGRDKPGSGGKERGLDAEVLNTIFSAKYPSTQFVSSGGNTEPDQRSAIALAILSKVFPSLEIWVVKDRDIASGKPATENDRQIYLQNNPRHHRVLKRWEIENYLYDGEVLTAYCSEKGLPFDATKYQQVVKNIVDDDVKQHTGAIKAACGIITSIDSETFKKNLATVIQPDMAVYKELEACVFERQ